MTYYVTVENGAAHRYTATVIGWPNCMAEGATREEAIARVKQRFTERLQQVEIVPIEVESTNLELTILNTQHPWAKFAGMYQANPLFDEVLASIQAYRRAIDEDETVV
ncbi:MAG: HicB family protein [Chloroflexi bacterium]|nr:MAG: HicB family protein [Chloroflexota bacterium]